MYRIFRDLLIGFVGGLAGSLVLGYFKSLQNEAPDMDLIQKVEDRFAAAEALVTSVQELIFPYSLELELFPGGPSAVEQHLKVPDFGFVGEASLYRTKRDGMDITVFTMFRSGDLSTFGLVFYDGLKPGCRLESQENFFNLDEWSALEVKGTLVRTKINVVGYEIAAEGADPIGKLKLRVDWSHTESK